jgi:Cupin
MSSNRFRCRPGRRLGNVFVITCAIAAGAVLSGGATLQPNFIRVAPANVAWHDIPGGHGAQEAVLFGDPSKEGMYVIRVKFPPHLMDLPHWHPNDRFVTVLEGTWYAGTGETFDAARAVPLKPGSFMMHPAKAAHWDGSRSDETVIVQIVGLGPADTTPVDPKQPIWIEVPNK